MTRTLAPWLLALLLPTLAFADPLTPRQIRSFDIKNLSSSSFDKRMEVYRIIKHQKWQEKYKAEAMKAILKQLKSKNVFQKRTGIQGANLLQYRTPEIQALVVKTLQAIEWKRSSQYIYLRGSLIEYLVAALKSAQKAEKACKEGNVKSLKKMLKKMPEPRK